MLKIFFFFLLCICSILASAPWLNEDKPNSILTEGDIALEDAPDSNEQRSAIEDYQVHASASSPWNRKWENNIVPYTLSRNFTTEQRKTILAAMTEIQEKTCISFVGREQETDFILFRKVPDRFLCSSLLGREGGRQHVNLTDKCVVRDTVLHELMHVLGFQHEHTRHDRDKYIRINLSNVKSMYKQHLKLIRKADPVDSLVHYDYKSITHYPEDAFSDYNNRKTIIPKFRAVKVKSDGLSEMDVWKINYMYNCSKEGENVESSNEHPEVTTTNIPIKQVQTTSSTTITETSIGTTLKTTTSTTTRPISVLNKEIVDAVEVGNENKVRTLLNEGADVIASTGEYPHKTLLHIATEKGNLNVVSLLLDTGANIEARSTDNKTPLHSAAWNGHVNVVSLLLDKRANIEAKDAVNWTPLHRAASNGHVNVVSLLLDKRANIEAKDAVNWTPLHRAASNGHVNVVSLLLDKRANIEAKDAVNWTPLHRAASNGHVNVISLLLDKRANIEAKDTANWTPLHHAASNGHVNVVSLLLDKRANIEAKDAVNWTPLHHAASNGHVNVVSLLLDKGANIEAKDTVNWTPLHRAAFRGHVNVVSLLLDKGANIEARTTSNQTPLDVAKRYNEPAIVEILERKQRQLITG